MHPRDRGGSSQSRRLRLFSGVVKLLARPSLGWRFCGGARAAGINPRSARSTSRARRGAENEVLRCCGPTGIPACAFLTGRFRIFHWLTVVLAAAVFLLAFTTVVAASLGLVLLPTAAALYHHFWRRDETLRAMLPPRRR